MDERTCNICGEIKPLSGFRPDPKSGPRPAQCRDCDFGPRTCTTCCERLPFEAFSPKSSKSDLAYQRNSRCKLCESTYQREYRLARLEEKRAYSRGWYRRNPEPRKAYARSYYQRNREQKRDWNLRRLYGVGAAEYDAMLTSQGGTCAICDGAGQRGLVVDHCHDSGEVRGLLCDRCNLNLGQLERMGLDRVTSYLKR